MQKLLGMLNWFRPFIKNLSIRIYEITNLLKKNVEINFTERMEKVICHDCVVHDCKLDKSLVKIKTVCCPSLF